MKGGGRFMMVAGVVLLFAGIAMTAAGESHSVGVALLVLGITFLAMQAGKGHAKGGEEDH